MSKIPLFVGVAGAGATFYAIRKAPLPLMAKAGISLAGGAVSAYAAHRLEKLIIPGEGSEQVGAAKTEAQQILKNNLALPPGERVVASHTPQQMDTFANKLYTAMDGMGTDDEAIADVFKAMNNDLDILLLIEKFGVRDDDDLATWIRDDGVAEDVNAILATKTQISKRF